MYSIISEFGVRVVMSRMRMRFGSVRSRLMSVERY